ncbi:hypothetical protein I7I48_02965 [Histoplasma ohiense]|nr:hypothetical protein I7I48_02965 [Histoplasma ohiense (nom. inval.)]
MKQTKDIHRVFHIPPAAALRSGLLPPLPPLPPLLPLLPHLGGVPNLCKLSVTQGYCSTQRTVEGNKTRSGTVSQDYSCHKCVYIYSYIKRLHVQIKYN